ncbi:seleno S-like [Octopus vulgaris]|uniref:Seleno S-like n=1 Tax=Octopus vulgaris TaxID=6645 RepID=A0AA36F4W7_OCTVU|nr:seleno S-like [Octopus vulgaris]
MEEADVENVIAEEEQENIVNKDPTFLLSFFETVKFVFEEYGWILLVVVILLIFAKSFLTPYLYKWRKKRDEEIYYSNYDNQKCQQTFEAMQKAREKMQRENDAKTELYLEQVKKREEKKRQMKLENLEGKLSSTSTLLLRYYVFNKTKFPHQFS